MKFLSFALLAAVQSVASATSVWNAQEVVTFLEGKPRAYFPFLFTKGGYRLGMEVGVADGRYSELFLTMCQDIPQWAWHMVEPFPNPPLKQRFPPAGNTSLRNIESWASRNIGKNAEITFHNVFSTDRTFVSTIEGKLFDFIYLDGAHDYANVKKELQLIWGNIKPGGMMAGHDYCNYGEAPLPCLGCDIIPECVPYSEYGVRHGKVSHDPHLGKKRSFNQNGVVKAVQEWLTEEHADLRLYYTVESFTRESLAADGLDFDLVITNSFNPSWYFFKPL